MKLITIASIIFETLKNTSKDLSEVIKIVTVVMNTLQQQGYVETTRGIEAETLDTDSIVLANQIIEQVQTEAA